MQAGKQMPIRCTRRIFLALCIILFMGCTTQGVPAQMGKYTRLRCRPDDFSSDCLEEQGAPIAVPGGAADTGLPPKADPILMKKFPDDPHASALSDEADGSGNEMELESGSGTEESVDGFIVPHFVVHQPDRDLEFRLTDEGLFPQKQRL